MKKFYKAPYMEAEEFEFEDVLLTSMLSPEHTDSEEKYEGEDLEPDDFLTMGN